MKLFHTENMTEVVYVQRQDLAYLHHETDVSIPASIFMKLLAEIKYVNDSNRFDFIKFDGEEDVKFFKRLEFIVDFEQYKDLTDEQLEEKRQELIFKGNAIAEKWNAMHLNQRMESKALSQEFHNIGYMVKFIFEVYAVKHKLKTMPFPEFVKM